MGILWVFKALFIQSKGQITKNCTLILAETKTLKLVYANNSYLKVLNIYELCGWDVAFSVAERLVKLVHFWRI